MTGTLIVSNMTWQNRMSVCDKMSQESITKDIVSLEADRDNTAWIVTRRADTLNASNVVCVCHARNTLCEHQLGI